MKNELVYPGKTISTSEELEPSKGTFEQSGIVYGSILGKLSTEKLQATVNGKTIRMLKKGDLVYAVLEDVLSEQMSLLKFQPVDNVGVDNSFAFMRISEIQKGYTERFSDYVKIGDYLKARIVEVKKLGTYLTIAEPDLGVVKANCRQCKKQMTREGNGFKCVCGNFEKRKVPK
ncbi:exosome complex RNA-binding protein Csl4 [Candidatus Micrarchaeota archaeon]|nr:exosome complex RNA-binding protein Csl4 [Candidatus Micrarchaeota archaeon]